LHSRSKTDPHVAGKAAAHLGSTLKMTHGASLSRRTFAINQPSYSRSHFPEYQRPFGR
jgi:hypothetical protein